MHKYTTVMLRFVDLHHCMDDCLVCRVHTRQSSAQNNKYQVSHKCSYFS